MSCLSESLTQAPLFWVVSLVAEFVSVRGINGVGREGEAVRDRVTLRVTPGHRVRPTRAGECRVDHVRERGDFAVSVAPGWAPVLALLSRTCYVCVCASEVVSLLLLRVESMSAGRNV